MTKDPKDEEKRKAVVLNECHDFASITLGRLPHLVLRLTALTPPTKELTALWIAPASASTCVSSASKTSIKEVDEECHQLLFRPMMIFPELDAKQGGMVRALTIWLVGPRFARVWRARDSYAL